MRETIRLIDVDGTALEPDGYPVPPVERLLDQYRSLLLGRRLNDQASALVRQGRLAVYPSSLGQEACQVAAASCLREGDWLFPTYRDTIAVIERGVDPVAALTLLSGRWHCGYDPREHRVAPQTTPLATQLPHAAGLAHAATLKGEDTVALALCGDGGTSEGDFHEALNFAAVFRAPMVVLVQNNKYAISVPLSRQSAAESLADKGVGYGVPAFLVDGNDVAALTAVLDQAVARAAAGGGPTLVEADTYRIAAHTNADDAGRYRSEDEATAWRPRDPLLRLRAYLRAHQALSEERETEFTAYADAVAGRLRERLGADVRPEPNELFAHVYATPTPQLRAQAEQLREELAAEGSTGWPRGS